MNEKTEPTAWRVRGYNQFKTGKPGPWLYYDGANRPKVNDQYCCDIEPLYAASPSSKSTKELSDEEISAICDGMLHQPWGIGSRRQDAIAFARAVLAFSSIKEDGERAEPKHYAEPPLLGTWHHGQGHLVSGTIRISRWDCDTNPPVEFRDKLLDWICATLNAAVKEWERIAPDELAPSSPPSPLGGTPEQQEQKR